MKKHSGIRPHNVIVQLKIAAKEAGNWYMKDLAKELGISASEISVLPKNKYVRFPENKDV